MPVEAMDYSSRPSTATSHSRKRSSAWIDEDDANDNSYIAQAYASVTLEDAPSKRLQNPRGEAVVPILKYNAQRLLNNLAFTRFYVTANFHNYNPAFSPVILCMVSEQNELYQALCQILPSLYQVAPSLQALAITAGYISPNSMSDQALLRILPLVTTACVEASIVEDFAKFRQELGGGPEGSLALINPEGTCIWTSAQAPRDMDVQGLERALRKVLGSGSGGDVAMG